MIVKDFSFIKHHIYRLPSILAPKNAEICANSENVLLNLSQVLQIYKNKSNNIAVDPAVPVIFRASPQQHV